MNKKLREKIRLKFNNRCAYCGTELTKGWHVDEMEPVRRNYKWNRDKTRYVSDGTMLHPERLKIENQVPACASCNINKHSMSLEEFRRLIQGFMLHLNERNTQYKIAKRYGLVREFIKPIVFYFEKSPEQKRQGLTADEVLSEYEFASRNEIMNGRDYRKMVIEAMNDFADRQNEKNV